MVGIIRLARAVRIDSGIGTGQPLAFPEVVYELAIFKQSKIFAAVRQDAIRSGGKAGSAAGQPRWGVKPNFPT